MSGPKSPVLKVIDSVRLGGSILVRLSNLTSQHLSFIFSLLLALLLAFEMINIQFRTA